MARAKWHGKGSEDRRAWRRHETARRKRSQGLPRTGILAALASGTLACSVLAQTAGEITPPTFQPGLDRLGGAIVFSGEPGLDAPAGAEALSVTLSGVAIEGGLPELAQAGQALQERLVGRPIPVSEIFEAAQDLEAAYAQEGYVLARVVLPAQTLRDGDRLRLLVVSGFVERVDVSNVPDPVRERVRAAVEPLVGAQDLKLGEIERRLLVAGDTPGVALTSALSTGVAPGSTILVVEGDFRPVTGFVGFNNSLSEELGEWVLDGGVEANSPFGWGETVYLRAYGHPDGNDHTGRGGLFDEDPRVRTLAAGAVFPIGVTGLTFNIEATRSQTTPEPFEGVQTASTFERLSFRLRYPWIRSRALNASSQLIFDIQSEDLDLLTEGGDLPLSQDDLRILRVTGDVVKVQESGAVVEANAIASFGVDSFGARGADDATPLVPLSRAGADADFQKVEVGLSYTRPVREHLAFSVLARGQTSFGQPLVESEQFGIASFRELSTFGAGTLSGDSGWLVRGDVLFPRSTQWRSRPLLVTPYAYAATGAVYLEEPTLFEESDLRASSIGIGVDIDSVIDPNFSAASLTAEFGRGFRDDDEDDENRFSLVGSIRF